MNNNELLINRSENIISALRQLNSLSSEALVLFVKNNQEQIIGSVTDGDIRRALINGAQLDDRIESVMHKDFRYIENQSNDITKNIKNIKKSGIQIIPILSKDKKVVRFLNLKNYITVLPIDAVLMAGGKGERLRPLTEKTPKPLLQVGDKCIIDHNIDRLISYGVEHISVTCNYLKEQLYVHFEEPRSGVKVDCVTEPKFLGTIGSIKFVETFHNDTILVMNSDLFTDINYEDFYLHFKEYDADMSIAAVPYTVSVPYGIMDLDGRNLKGMIEKPTYNYYANAGIYLIKRSMLELIPNGEFFHATDLINAILKINGKIIRFPLNGVWIDIGTPQEYQKAKDLVKHLY